MNRRKAMQSAAVLSAALLTPVLTGNDENQNPEQPKSEGGWFYKDLEYEKHIPVVAVTRDGETAAISIHVKHPQIAEHHISTFKIYDENRIEMTECDLHPVLSTPHVVFYLNLPEGTPLIATSDCNIHGIWMKKFTL